MPLDNALLPPATARQIQKQLQLALATAFATVDIRDETDSDGADTPAHRYQYLLQPQLLVYQEKRGSLQELLDIKASGPLGNDELAVKLRLYRATPQQLMDTTLIQARSWPGLTRDSIGELFTSAFRRYALKLSALGSYQDQ